jgi:hypothetical protein
MVMMHGNENDRASDACERPRIPEILLSFCLDSRSSHISPKIGTTCAKNTKSRYGNLTQRSFFERRDAMNVFTINLVWRICHKLRHSCGLGTCSTHVKTQNVFQNRTQSHVTINFLHMSLLEAFCCVYLAHV